MTVLDMELEVRRHYIFTFKGHKIPFSEEEFLEARQLFNQKFSEVNRIPSDVSVEEMRKLLNEMQEKTKKKYPVEKSKTIPLQYEVIGKIESDPRNGHEGKPYVYFGDKEQNYAFHIEGDDQFFFIRLGNILNERATIGRFLNAIPYDVDVSKSDMLKKKVVTNSAYIKALFDILEIIKEIRKVRMLSDKRRDYYRRIRKTNGLEGEKTYDFREEVRANLLPAN